MSGVVMGEAYPYPFDFLELKYLRLYEEALKEDNIMMKASLQVDLEMIRHVAGLYMKCAKITGVD